METKVTEKEAEIKKLMVTMKDIRAENDRKLVALQNELQKKENSVHQLQASTLFETFNNF